MKVLLQVDSLIYQALGEMAAAARVNGQALSGSRWERPTRASLMRDAMYTAVWNAHNGGSLLLPAPACPKALEGLPWRVLDGRTVPVDSRGLVIDGPCPAATSALPSVI